jgi:hypothetical protein
MSSQRTQPGNRTLWKPVAAELVGTVLGVSLAVGQLRISWMRAFEIQIAKLYHFEPDPAGSFSQAVPLQAPFAHPPESIQDG